MVNMLNMTIVDVEILRARSLRGLSRCKVVPSCRQPIAMDCLFVRCLNNQLPQEQLGFLLVFVTCYHAVTLMNKNFSLFAVTVFLV